MNTDPVVIRRILGQLKKAGLVEVHAAAGGTFLRRAPAGISLLDVYRAVEVVAEGKLLHVHEGLNPRCPMGVISRLRWTLRSCAPKRRWSANCPA